ncbi:MAG TPA: hypothetical protein VIT91_11025 [Chthoniobacterales bacterium]
MRRYIDIASRVCALAFAAYIGSLLGSSIFAKMFSGKIQFDWQLLNPLGVATVIGLGVVTPIANIFLLITGVISILIIIRIFPIWTTILVGVGFAMTAFSLLNAWRVP